MLEQSDFLVVARRRRPGKLFLEFVLPRPQFP